MDLGELLRLPGVEEKCLLRSPVGFMALHGGSQDRGTDLLARRAADRAGASYYAIVQPPGLRVHLTSRRHDPAQSPTLAIFLAHVDVAISVHGFGRDSFSLQVDPMAGVVVEPYGPALRGRQAEPLTGIILGGLHAPLLARARTLLADRFAGFHVADERIRLGYHPDNPVNLPSGHGLQIELPPGLRGIGPFGDHLVPDDGPVEAEVVTALVELAELAELAATMPAPDGPPGTRPHARGS